MKGRLTYKQTNIACYIGYIVQAAVNNFSPLLFVTFNKDFGISLEKIGLIILINFSIQIIIDISSALFVDRIGYRASALLAHIMSFIGFISLGTLPYIISPFVGIVISTAFLAVGGGLIEVIISPMIEALPNDNKSASMSLLHSFYCWGQVLTVLLSTLIFSLFGIGNWRIAAFVWSLIPLFNIIAFSFVPIASLPMSEDNAEKKKFRLSCAFICLMILMICSGATEIAMSQWASLFFESVIGIDKTLGDLLGPCIFALLMGIGRIIGAIFGKKVGLENIIFISAILSLIAYLAVSLSTSPVIALIGCALCGLAVSVMWPTTYSLGAKYCPLGGTTMFALFAFAGDIGCTIGPQIVTLVSDSVSRGKLGNFMTVISGTAETRGLRLGLFFIVIFPIITLISITVLNLYRKKHNVKKPQ